MIILECSPNTSLKIYNFRAGKGNRVHCHSPLTTDKETEVLKGKVTLHKLKGLVICSTRDNTEVLTQSLWVASPSPMRPESGQNSPALSRTVWIIEINFQLMITPHSLQNSQSLIKPSFVIRSYGNWRKKKKKIPVIKKDTLRPKLSFSPPNIWDILP